MDTTNVDRLDQYISEGRITRNTWTGQDEKGRETACLLAALSPEVGRKLSASACPAEIMPAWFAHLTPWFNDRGSREQWPAMIARYAGLARGWHVLTADDWQSLDYQCRAFAVREAMTRARSAEVRAVCTRVVELCDRAASGGAVSRGDWEARAADAEAAAAAADAEAAEAAAEAAWAAAWAAAADAEAAATAAADRITARMLGAIEARIARITSA